MSWEKSKNSNYKCVHGNYLKLRERVSNVNIQYILYI